MAQVELKQLNKAWGEVVAVDAMDLVIEDGEFVAILGPSGCGKSTTLFMLAGIYAPTGGELRFDGRLVNDVEAKDRNVGIVMNFQAVHLQAAEPGQRADDADVTGTAGCAVRRSRGPAFPLRHRLRRQEQQDQQAGEDTKTRQAPN